MVHIFHQLAQLGPISESSYFLPKTLYTGETDKENDVEHMLFDSNMEAEHVELRSFIRLILKATRDLDHFR